MAAHSSSDAVLAAAESVIGYWSKRLSRLPGFSSSDEDDLAQELRLYVLRKSGLYDATRGSLATFGDRVVRSRAKMIIRDRRRQKRAPVIAMPSLDAPSTSSDDEPDTLGCSLKLDDLTRRTGWCPRGPIQLLEDREATWQALEEMPPDLREFCQLLMNETLTSVARIMGISRREGRNRLEEARAYFERAGHGDF